MAVARGYRHPEWSGRTDGSVLYTGDLRPAGLLHAAVLRSPHPNARVLEVDTSAARRLPGVHAVISADDLPEIEYTDYGVSDRPALARDTVRYIGQEVAAVAADSPEIAQRAVELIRVRFQPLRNVTDVDSALKPNASEVHAGSANISARRAWALGDHAATQVHQSVRGRFTFGVHAHACMEPHTVLATYQQTAGLEVWAPTQGPRNLRRELAKMLELDEAQVRVHRVAAGGDFGSRVRASDIEVIAAALAMQCSRPVRLQLDRNAEFAFTKHRHDFAIELDTGVDKGGHVVHRSGDIVVENGGYTHAGANELNYCGLLLASQYRLTGASITGRAAYTNTRPGGAFRGAGGPQAVFAIESQMDELADLLGWDPIEFRIANVNRPGDVTITGWEIDSSRLVDCLDAVRREIGWVEKRKLGGSGRGVGVAVAMHVSGALGSELLRRSEATVEIDTDGHVLVRSGSADPGTGQPYVAAIVCAQQLGIEPGAVEVLSQDTAETPYDPGAGASKGTFMTGNAALQAGRSAADHLRELAAEKLAVPPDSVQLRAGFAEHGADRIPLGDLVAVSPDAIDGRVAFTAEYVVELPVVATPDGVGNLSPAYSFAAHAVEVEVDRSTGAVTVVNVVAAHDSGTIINETAASGQVTGGVVMGLGAALGEELIFEGGRVATGGYVDYAMPRAGDVPPIAVRFLEAPSPRGPLGAKGLAEIALSPTPAAVANAVAHATGIRVRDLPITPDKVISRTRRAGRRRRRLGLRRPWVDFIRWLYPRGLHHALHRYGTKIARKPGPQQPLAVVQPSTVEEAVHVLSDSADSRPLGAGSDLLVARSQGIRPESTLVDLTSVPTLGSVEIDSEGNLSVGAAATLSALGQWAEEHDCPALEQAIDTIASAQIRNVATVAGNLCQEKRCWFFRNGFQCFKSGGATCPCYAVLGDHRFYHAAMDAHRCQAVTPSDLATVFAALDAEIRTERRGGGRRLSIDQLYTGPGETVLRTDELITHVIVPRAALLRGTTFQKLAMYDGGFATVSAAASIATDPDGVVTEARAVLGGIAPTPVRIREAEDMLVGRRPDEPHVREAAASWLHRAHPLPGNAWKPEAGQELLFRCLMNATGAS